MQLKENAHSNVALVSSVIVGVNHRTAVDDAEDQAAQFGAKEDVVDLLVKGGRYENVAVGEITDAEDVRGKLRRKVNTPKVVETSNFIALVGEQAIDVNKLVVQVGKGSLVAALGNAQRLNQLVKPLQKELLLDHDVLRGDEKVIKEHDDGYKN